MRRSTKKLIFTLVMAVLAVLSPFLFWQGMQKADGTRMLIGIVAFVFSVVKLFGMYRNNLRDALPWLAIAYTVIVPFCKSALLKLGDSTFYVAVFVWIIALIYSVRSLTRMIPETMFRIASFLYAYTIGISKMKNSEIFKSLVEDVNHNKPDAIVLYGKYQNIKGMPYDYDDKKGYRFNHICLVDSITENDRSMQQIIDNQIQASTDLGSYKRGIDYCFTGSGYRTLSRIEAYSLYKALCSELPEYGNHQGLEMIHHGTLNKPTGKTYGNVHVSGDGKDIKYTVEEHEDIDISSYSLKIWYAFFLVRNTVSIADTNSDYSREKEKKAEEVE